MRSLDEYTLKSTNARVSGSCARLPRGPHAPLRTTRNVFTRIPYPGKIYSFGHDVCVCARASAWRRATKIYDTNAIYHRDNFERNTRFAAAVFHSSSPPSPVSSHRRTLSKWHPRCVPAGSFRVTPSSARTLVRELPQKLLI